VGDVPNNLHIIIFTITNRSNLNLALVQNRQKQICPISAAREKPLKIETNNFWWLLNFGGLLENNHRKFLPAKISR
jgi:hypothetical protein